MKKRIHKIFFIFLLISFLFPMSVYAIDGDADGNGILDIEDARHIAKFVVGQISFLKNPFEADVNQDGKQDMEDAFAIARKVNGNTSIILVAPRYGRSDKIRLGDTIRIEVFEKFFPFNFTSGSAVITSDSTGYDSGDQRLLFSRAGRSFYLNWDTKGLKSANDYKIKITLNNSNENSKISESTITLNNNNYEPPYLASFVDASAPVPGIPFKFVRVMPHDSTNYPYLGPFGMGWVHNFDISLDEFTDGSIGFHSPDGFNRFFKSNADGTYESSLGDYGKLTRDSDGSFTLKEKDNIVYHFIPYANSDRKLQFDFVEDLNGNRISATYNQKDQLEEITHSSGQKFTLNYDLSGRIISLTDHVGKETTYEYDGSSLLLIKVIDPIKSETKYLYNFVDNESDLSSYSLLVIAFPDGSLIHFEYDENDRLVRKTSTDGAFPISYNYSQDGTTTLTDGFGGDTSVLFNDSGKPSSIKDPEGDKITYGYDGFSNLTKIIDSLGGETSLDYDAFGNITDIINPLNEKTHIEYNLKFNMPSTIIKPLGNITEYDYDENGNLQTIVFPDQSQEWRDYDKDGNLLSFTDTEGNMTRFSYNNRGQIDSIINSLDVKLQLDYAHNGDLTSITNYNKNIFTFSSDTLGRLTKINYPNNLQETFEYNPMGRLSSFINRKGNKFEFIYHVTGKLKEINYPSGKVVRFFYSGSGLLSYVETIGETGNKEEISVDPFLEFDLSGRVVFMKTRRNNKADTYDISIGYNSAGNRDLMVYPDGYMLHYVYDKNNRLSNISDNENKIIVTYEYDSNGRRVKRTLGNGTYTTYEYDTNDRLLELINFNPVNQVMSSFKYMLNSAGLRTHVTTQEGVHTYEYDNIYQLTSVEYADSTTVSYAFDPNGNRTRIVNNFDVTEFEVNNLDQYTNVGTKELSYDLNGNILDGNKPEIVSYKWDDDNNLTSIVRTENSNIEYTYDFKGLLTSKTLNEKRTQYVWNNRDLIAEFDSSEKLIKRYIYGENIDEIICVTSNDVTHWAQHDALGSVVTITNDSGNIVSKPDYDVYGNLKNGDPGIISQRFAGMLWDNDAQLYYVRNRWYSATLGRFLSVDPKGFDAGVNFYTYSENNPINLIDPTGLMPIGATKNKGEAFGDVFGLVNSAADFLENPIGPLADALIIVDTIKDFEDKIPKGQKVSVNVAFDKKTRKATISRNSQLFSSDSDRFYKISTVVTGTFDEQKSKRAWRHVSNNAQPLGRFGLPVSGSGSSLTGSSVGSGGNVGGGTGGGLCPTFVQIPLFSKLKNRNKRIIKNDIIAEITVPVDNALLRSDIPIFGIAGGKDFKRYRVEYGKGLNPTKWNLIETSDTPQNKTDVGLLNIPYMQGDIDIRGNLATWNTGLKNWTHLPWHPPEDNTDFNGVYTIRLVVEGSNGQTVEDRVTCEVGRVIAQCLPGITTSSDEQVTMEFPEQSLTNSFRIYTILPMGSLDEPIVELPKEFDLVGKIYKIREPGDKFIKDVVLKFKTDKKEVKNRKFENIGIANFDIVENKWNCMKTEYDDISMTFSTKLEELPSHKAIFALVYNKKHKNLSSLKLKETDIVNYVQPVSAGILIDNNFEQVMGTFKKRDRFVGASLSLDNASTQDGSYALKFKNENHGGNFSSTVIDTPFDVRKYGIMSFDYKIGRNVKIDYYLRVNGRWFNLRFTGDPVDFKNRDVNIANLGEISNIICDNKWHTVSIDLRYLLGQQTRHTLIDKIVMANWEVDGYMKLEFGNNPRNAEYFIDNFKIIGDGNIVTNPLVLYVDNFNEKKSNNNLGGPHGAYKTPGSNFFSALLTDVPISQSGIVNVNYVENNALLMNFDVSRLDAYGGWWTSIANCDLSNYSTLNFKLLSDNKIPNIYVGIRNKSGIEGKTLIQTYVSEIKNNDWRDVCIPLTGLKGISNLSSPDVLFFSVSSKDRSGKGSIYIDDLRFQQKSFAIVDDFELGNNWSMLGGNYENYQNGAGAVSSKIIKDFENAKNSILRISYGGSIGKDYGLNGGFSYAGWRAGLKGIDARDFSYLTLQIKGEEGNEIPNIYLNDSAKRIPLRAKNLPEITKKWQTMRIPLDHYEREGLDLSKLEALEICFEWEKQSGSIYIDNLKFE